ncbi:hypothetical protein ACI3PL_30295, partial [Lacticaseibacillus paracasei]
AMIVELKTYKDQSSAVATFVNEARTQTRTATGTESELIPGTYIFDVTDLADGYYDYTIALPGDGSSAGAIQVSGQVVVN